MIDISVVINQMLVLLILIGVGYLIRMTGLGDYNMQEVITKLILNATAPAMMLSSVSGGQAKGSPMEVLLVFLIALIMYLVLPFIGMGLVKLLKVKKEDINLYIFMTTFSNVGFMGFPVIRSIFGESGVFYTAIFNMIFNLFSFSYGMALMSGKEISKKPKDYVNLGIVAAIVTIVLYFMKVPFHPAVHQSIKTLGDATTPFAMIVIGMSLATIPLNTLFEDLRIIPFTIIKQVLVPILSLYLLRPIIKDPLILGVTVIIIAMPVATNCVLFATKFNNNVKVATRGVFITTIASLITIPILSYVLHL